jgi:hypothetical protein
LDADALSLWGMRYGTHLAFAALKQPGLKIDRLLPMGTEGPNQTIKLPLDADALLESLITTGCRYCRYCRYCRNCRHYQRNWPVGSRRS